MRRLPIKTWLLSALASSGIVLIAAVASADTNYGAGTYGSCQYGSCGLSLSSNGAVNLNITPTSSGVCTIQSDTISVTTDNSNGYSLSLADAATSSSLSSGGHTIAATSGTFASPQTLANNSWGYRVDGVGSFGAGPTTAQSSGAPSSLLFAAVPTSLQTSDTLANTTGPANPAANTTVWYGVCANTNTVTGTYTSQVTYTATVN